MNLALIQTHNYSQVEILNFYQVNRQWLHVPNELKSNFHIISVWHMNDCMQLKEIKARRQGKLGGNTIVNLIVNLGFMLLALPMEINYFIPFLCFQMIFNNSSLFM